MSTSTTATPAGYLRIETERAVVWVTPEARDWADDAVLRGVTLFDAGSPLRVSGPARLGRGAIRVVSPESTDDRWVVRHYRRGGTFRSILKDRYLRIGTPRPFLELEASRKLVEGGIRTPAVIAAAVYPRGPFYRGDLVTRYAEARQLISVLSEPNKAERHNRALKGVSRAILRLARLGAHHVDLNATNLLVDDDLDAVPWVIDLDRMRFGVPPAEATRAMSARLKRSLAKLECSPTVLEMADALLPTGAATRGES